MNKKNLIATFIIFLLSGSALFSQNGQINIETDIIGYGKNYLGTPYLYGGSENNGFDCSGFVSFVYRRFINGFPRTVADQIRQGSRIGPAQLQPGDLVFFATGDDPQLPSHVAIYIGDNSLLHSISEGENTGVVISSLDSNYWQQRYLFARRVLNVSSNEQVAGGFGDLNPRETYTQPLAAVFDDTFSRSMQLPQLERDPSWWEMD